MTDSKKPKKEYKLVKWYFEKEIEIPESWEVMFLKDLCTVRQGLQIPISERFEESGPNRLPYITVKSIHSDSFTEYIESPQKRVICNEDDVLFTRTGNTGEIITNIKGVFHNNFFLIDLDRKKVFKDYLVYFLKQQKIQEIILSLAGSTTIPDLNHNDFFGLRMTMPPFQEQQKIASILSDVDNLIDSYDRAIETTRKLKKSMIQQLLTRGIGHTKFKKVKDRFRNQFEIPDKWEYVQIGQLVKEHKILEIQDGNHGELHPKTYDFVEIGIPFITADCLIQNKIDYTKCNSLPEKFLKTLRIGFSKQDDVILSHKGSIGNTAIVDNKFKTIILSPQTTYYRLSDDIISHFLYYVFQSLDFQRQLKSFAKQSTRDYVGITNQRHIFIPYLSSKDEQDKIATILSTVDSKINDLESEKSSLEQLKKGLMQKLLTGQIRVKV